jgi:hypothetical protein
MNECTQNRDEAVRTADQTLFIPVSIRPLGLSAFPQSAELASTLRRLRISEFDDLIGFRFVILRV